MEVTDTEEAARALGRRVESFNARNERDLDDVFAKFEPTRPGTLLVIADPFFLTRANQIIAAMAQLSIPALYWRREWVTAGGLMSYGSSLDEGYRVLADYVGRILRGEKAADLPVLQPTRFELVFNLKTAKALGLRVPPSLLAIADEVIQ
jgi:putative ABC transport system substrate-binding protein